MNQEYDVCIAGGGVAGCAAAIAAARNGAKTLLIEEAGFLGGSLTLCGVGPMMTYFAGDHQIIKGIGEEIVNNLIQIKGSGGHIKDTTKYVSYTTPFSSEMLKFILDEMMAEEDVDVLFHTSVVQVSRDQNKIKEIIINNCDGISNIQAKIYIDTTGDGDLAFMSGVPMIKGRKSDGQMQPMTMNIKYSNINIDKLKKYILDHIEEFPRLIGKEDLIKSSKPLAVAGFTKQLKEAIARNELSIPREELLFFETNISGEVIMNTTRVIGLDPTNAKDLSKAEQLGRKQSFELDCFLHKEIPGFESAILEYTGPKIGIRGSRQIVGAYTLTAEDILSRKYFSTKICLSAYPIDIHNPSGAGTDSSFLSEPGFFYELPYEILYSKELENMLVAGRCVSATFEAQAAIRTTPTVFALGQAAGIAAALCVRGSKNVSELDVKALQEKLIQQGVILNL